MVAGLLPGPEEYVGWAHGIIIANGDATSRLITRFGKLGDTPIIYKEFNDLTLSTQRGRRNAARSIVGAEYPETELSWVVCDDPNRTWKDLPPRGSNIIRLPRPLVKPTLLRIVEVDIWHQHGKQEIISYLLLKILPDPDAEDIRRLVEQCSPAHA